jgi:predicted ATPase
MVFAFSGSHRSGKTTLARRVSEDLGIEFYETKTGEVLKQAGINIVADMPIRERMKAQELLLDYHLQMIKELPRPLIVDRCPIDMLAYTLGEIGMHTIHDPELDAQIMAYSARCLHSMELHYAGAVICQPLPSYDAQDGKPPPSRAYQQHIHHLIVGGFDALEYVSYQELVELNFERRVELASEFICLELEDIAKAKEQIWVN